MFLISIFEKRSGFVFVLIGVIVVFVFAFLVPGIKFNDKFKMCLARDCSYNLLFNKSGTTHTHTHTHTHTIQNSCIWMALIALSGGVFSFFRNYLAGCFFLILSVFFIHLLKTKKNLYKILAVYILSVTVLWSFNPLFQKAVYKYTKRKNPGLKHTHSIVISYKTDKLMDFKPQRKHQVWHNAFIGLGVYPNKWDIVWDDAVGFAFAAKESPGVLPYSKKYLSIEQCA